MSVSAEALTAAFPEIDFQEASLDIWDKKYRLKAKDGRLIDETVDDTYRRVARALADAEEGTDAREHWYREFLWALRRGVIPAGRITSNAGAQAYKPATSTINCTVSGTIGDSMDDILAKVHEAGLTLKAGCGIGYEHSTLRPKGAYVTGAGAHTSGPLSFMDIFDKMCFTVSSAGGRRGAQMSTFDVSHPDVMDFIRAKRENGVLRQFNCSLLITDDFIRAVKEESDWPLVFPVLDSETGEVDLNDPEQVIWREWPVHSGYVVNDEGLVACKVYNKVPAKRLWNMIMTSTYDYAEPGFILVDRINEQNNNWFVENIRATNPCVTADTRLATQFGMVPIGELYRRGDELEVTVDKRTLGGSANGVETRPAVPAFMTASDADVWRVETEAGYEIKATEWHDFYTTRGKIKLKDLRPDDELLIQSGKGQFGDQGDARLGMLLGLITGDGQITNRGRSAGSKDQVAAVVNFWGEERTLADSVAEYVNEMIADVSDRERQYRVKPVPVAERNMVFLRSVLLARVLEHYGFTKESKFQVPEVVWRGSEECVRGYLQALFQCDGTVNATESNSCCTIRLASSHRGLLRDVQMLLANFGVLCRIHERRKAGKRMLPDGNGGTREYDCRADHELIIGSDSREVFMREIGFLLDYKNDRYNEWAEGRSLRLSKQFVSKIRAISHVGREAVFDTTQPDHNSLIFNGIVTGNCGEQPLPAYGSCLLGSVNLTRFVDKPFTEEASFNWDEYRKAVKVFTRMLDNVVEVNGLPLKQQRHEIEYKRRHGMGFLGLGSASTMLRMAYGSPESLEFTEKVSREMAVAGWEAGLELAQEKGPAPIMVDEFEVTPEMLRKRPEMVRDGYKHGDRVPGRVLHARYSRYMQKVAEVDPELVDKLAETGARFTHHTSIAPTGTISLSLANNASNGIEPSFAHHYNRNVIREGKKSKEKVSVFSYELLAYRALVNPKAMPFSEDPEEQLPDYFVTAEQITPKEHVAIQAAAQKWIDSSISKTANVPTEYPYEDFKDIYLYAWEQGLKGCTTFRFNPEAFQGVLVTDKDLESTTYVFELEDGSQVELTGGEEVEYDGETHTAANLFDALKEGYYGKF
jgi:ribonucleoside-diphosphate reductase alpha chain